MIITKTLRTLWFLPTINSCKGSWVTLPNKIMLRLQLPNATIKKPFTNYAKLALFYLRHINQKINFTSSPVKLSSERVIHTPPVSVWKVKFYNFHKASNLAIFMKHLQICSNLLIFKIWLLRLLLRILASSNFEVKLANVTELRSGSITWVEIGLGGC